MTLTAHQRAQPWRLRGAALALALLNLPGMIDAVAAEREGVVGDLAYGDALFHFYQEDYFSAAIQLLVAREQDRLQHHSDDAELLLGGIYLSYGQQDEAEAIFARLLDDGASPQVRDRAWLYAAQIAYQRGRPDGARAALVRIGDHLEAEDAARAALLAAQVDIEAGDYAAATEQLDGLRAPPAWRAYANYNLGVALIRHGQTERGTALLERAGNTTLAEDATLSNWLKPWRWLRRSAADIDDYSEAGALRDKINLALGFAHLKGGDAESAQRVLARVSDDSPWASRARLGGGWAAVESESFDQALTQWRALADGDPLDPAVQESRLGVPYALARLGDQDAALAGYRDAIDTFAAQIDALNGMAHELVGDDFLQGLLDQDGGNEVGWFWSLDEVPDDARGRYLYRLMADHEFQEGLKNYRDLTALRANLARWTEGVAAFELMLRTRVQRFERQSATVAGDDRAVRLAALEARVRDFERRVDQADTDNDAFALATDDELAALARLDDAATRLARYPHEAQLTAARDKQRLLRGVLLWRLNEAYPARLWAARKDYRGARDALVQAQALSGEIDAAQHDEPRNFDDFEQRIAAARPRIAGLAERVDASLLAHENFLKGIAIDQFNAHTQRLQAYLTEAQFSLASTYDRMSSAEARP